MKVLVFIDHDIICRHFVMNGALAPLVERANVCFVFPNDGGKRVKTDLTTLALGARLELLPIDAVRQQTWRWMLYADQLKPRLGAHEAAIRRVRWRTLGWKSAMLLTLAGVFPGSIVFRKLVGSRLRNHPATALKALLERERPDIVLHPTVLDGVFMNDLVSECRERGISLVAVMNSWDNPSTKRTMVGKPDWLLAWGEQTCRHAVRFMGMDPQRVVPFGAAQFDVFREPPRLDRDAFCAEHGIDPAQRIVLFAGSNAKTDEFSTLTELDDAITKGRLRDVAVVYRPHPWGGGGRDGARLASARWRNVTIHKSMRDYVERLASGERVGITLPDYRDTHDLLAAVDVVVSPMSTILAEAALHGKPIAVYAPRGPDGSVQLSVNLPLLHFEEFFAVDEVKLSQSADELIARLSVLADPIRGSIIGEKLRASMVPFVAPFEWPWKERVVEFLEQRAGRSPAAQSLDRALESDSRR
jgi:hypothetical protein